MRRTVVTVLGVVLTLSAMLVSSDYVTSKDDVTIIKNVEKEIIVESEQEPTYHPVEKIVMSDSKVVDKVEERYTSVSADWGADIYEDGFIYYEIPADFKKAGGELPEVVQVYLWGICKEKGLDYHIVLALIEKESGYKSDVVGDSGKSKGYMQVQERYHTERMEEAGVVDLLDPYGNIRVATDYLADLYDRYGSSGDNCVLMVYNMGVSGANKLWDKGIYSSEYSRYIVSRANEIKQELEQD